MSAPPSRADDELPLTASAFHVALAYLMAHLMGLAGVAWSYESLRAWAVEGPVLSCTVRVPLLVVAGVVTELAVLAIGAGLWNPLARSRTGSG